MKILCGSSMLDLDKMNGTMPDGSHVWAEVMPYTYEPDKLPVDRIGTYLLTSDGGAVSFRDLAFKILFDMCVWSGARCGRYLAREIARGVSEDMEHGWSVMPVPEYTAAGKLFSELGLSAVYMPRCDLTLDVNLAAFREPCDLDGVTNGLLSEYIYTAGRSFVSIHDALSSLLISLPSAELAAFIDGFYGVMALTPEELAHRAAQAADEQAAPDVQDIGEEHVSEPEQEPATEPDAPDTGNTGVSSGSAPDVQGPQEKTVMGLPVAGTGVTPASGMTASEARSGGPLMPGAGLFTKGRMLKGSDLTGTDETYIQGYYTGFYNTDLEKADSEGFADRLIRARAGDGVSPIAILDEACEKLRAAMDIQMSGENAAADLRSQLMGLSEAVFQVADAVKAAKGASALENKAQDSAGDLDSEPAGESETDTAPDAPVPGSAQTREPETDTAPDTSAQDSGPADQDAPPEGPAHDVHAEPDTEQHAPADIDLSGIPDDIDDEYGTADDGMEVPDETMPDEDGPDLPDIPDIDDEE